MHLSSLGMNSDKTIGILFFARTPECEADVKRWTPSRRRNIKLAEKLHERAWKTISSVGLPVVVFDNSMQEGSTFNEKISNALVSFFDEGYDHAIVLGSDCPELKVEDIRKSHQNLKNGIQTIGESEDGGVYLFTISKKDFELEFFQNLPWCSPSLFDGLISAFEISNLSICFLGRKIDLDDNLNVLKKWFYTLELKFRLLLFSLFNFLPIIAIIHAEKKTFAISSSNRRGPPL